ncbi:MAG: hypothetical protein BSOLF_2584 [Candidatus Carbobacillus altaicus]|uniref:Uncharacterized protein n=1 Tax=Candidatus Carbonibacillus altaicus TaxID=2163959 RepID=A0A2R6XXZ2_9BACL|nr:MAG: hypothetical protein BSOLF_2584 [Candidatus Carbobacillus altaicus]
MPIYFTSKTVDSSGINGRAVIKSLSVRINPAGFELGEPESSGARSSDGPSDSIISAPGNGTSAFQNFPNAQLRMVVTATIDGIYAYEKETTLFSPNFTLFTLTGLQANIAGQSFSSDVANKLDFIRPGEKVDLTAVGSYITGNVDGGSIPPQAAAKIPIPTFPFTFTFSNDTLFDGLNNTNISFSPGAIRDGKYNTVAQDNFLAQIPTKVPLSKQDNPIKRGYTFMGVMVNTRAFYNDYKEFPSIKEGLVDKIKSQINPLAKTAYDDLTSIDPDVLRRSYGTGYTVKYRSSNEFASILANYIADKIIDTLEKTYADDQTTNQSEGAFSENVATYMRILPANAQEEYSILYTKYYSMYKNAQTPSQQQEAIKRFNAELDNLVAKYYSESYAKKVWFSITEPLKGIGVRLKQDDVLSARGAFISGIPDAYLSYVLESDPLKTKNLYAAYKLLNGSPDLLTIAMANEMSGSNAPMKPELSWLDADYVQLVRYGKTYQGYLSFTNYSDVPITNFIIRTYLFNARTGQLLNTDPRSQTLGYVYGTEYTFSNPSKKVIVNSDALRSVNELFGSIPPLKDMYDQEVRFFEPGKTVFVPINITIPTNDPVILIATAGASYTSTLTKSVKDRWYEYVFQVERKFYFKSQDQPSMFVGFAPNKIMTRETEAKYGGGLVAKFSIANSNDQEMQRQIALHNQYGVFDEADMWKVPVRDLKERITIQVLKPYDITVGGLDETTELKGGYWVPGSYKEIEWERTIWNIDPKK